MEEQLLVSASPHVRDPDTISRIMWRVVLALLPAVAMSLYYFRLDAVRLYVVCIVTAELAELACLGLRGKPLSQALDGSAFVTGLLLAMVLPASAASYCGIVGAAFAIAIAKHTFGGLGNNIWNPALAGRVFLQFAYADQISLAEWPVPYPLLDRVTDAATMASPLTEQGMAAPLSYMDLWLGNGVTGCLGETCKIALLVGGLFLILRRTIDWRVPAFYIGTVYLLSWALPLPKDAPPLAADPIYQILSGGLFIGAFFMATDMVTTPVTAAGRAVFGIGCGLIVAVVRRYGGYPEGVAYSILLMNTATPLIDRWIRPPVYGSRTPKATPR
jgi:electron transport complex protein RnfD